MQKKFIFAGIGIIFLSIALIFIFTKVRIGFAPVKPLPTPASQTFTENNRKMVRAFNMDIKKIPTQSLSGKASVIENGAKTIVMLKIANPPLASLSAKLQTGTCAQPTNTKYNLNTLADGESETELDISFDDLLLQIPVSIGVSKGNTKGYDFCGDMNQ